MSNEAQIFARAIDESDVDQRNRLVDELCGDDHQLKARVKQLLAAHEQPETFFIDPIGANVDPTALRNEPIALTGSTIGPYKLLQQIGEGGMGLVFMAEQTEPVKRRVALKVIKPGMDSRQVIARFEAERQALALMDHPNIARVLDAGTTDRGYPYFVMELVNGMPITEYCDQEKMSTDQRLQLFVSVCLAVQHAHQKGVIHRDLKPGNILVAEYDGVPVPKVIDFGVAKATGASLTDKTLFTQFGQVIGTMEYMSPEQARRNQLDVDTRSDIYSLGIVLYKLLTGETPFGEQRFRDAALDEMLYIIREEHPPRPSVKIGSSQSLDQIAERRSIEAARLTSAVRGDLDWIVLKTLEKDRNQRYQTTSELADDISRHLNQLPVNARPKSLTDRFGKYVRRNRKLIFQTVVASVIAWIATSAVVDWVTDKWTDKQARTERLQDALDDGQLALSRARASVLGDPSHWDNLHSQLMRMIKILEEGPIEQEIRQNGWEFVSDGGDEIIRRQIAEQIEEIVIRGATKPDLESWQSMEAEMREFFRLNGFDLDNDDPAVVGQQIRDVRGGKAQAELWADLLELWIGTHGHMQSIGGPQMTAEFMQPWADAIYVADTDPIRTGIRKFIYTFPRPSRETLDLLIKDVDLSTLRPRTLAWLGSAYDIIKEHDQVDEIFREALLVYPHDLMLNFDYAYILYGQERYEEAARIYHRCLALRNDVPGLWSSLGMTLEKLGEHEEAKLAMDRSVELEKTRPPRTLKVRRGRPLK